MDKTDKTVLGCLAMLAVFFVLGPILYALNGIVLSQLWSWFAVSAFGLPSITMVQAIGISIIVWFLTASRWFLTASRTQGSQEKSDASSVLGAVIAAFLQPLIVLGVGWIVYQFM